MRPLSPWSRVGAVGAMLFVALGTALAPEGCAPPCPGGTGCFLPPRDAATDALASPDDGAPFDAPTVDVPTVDVPAVDAPGSVIPYVSLRIEPAEASVAVDDGAPRTVRLRGYARRDDGTEVALDPRAIDWSVSHERLARVEPDATFTAFGQGAGDVTVRARFTLEHRPALEATAIVHIALTRTARAAGLDPALATAAERFTDVTPEPGDDARIVYPLEGAMMPNNVPPPEVQWISPSPGDLYRLVLTRGNAQVTVYLPASSTTATHGLAVPESTLWRALTESAPGEPLRIRLDRGDARTSQFILGRTATVQIAYGGVFGSVYYWHTDAGRLLRIDPDGGEARDFMPSPPVREHGGPPERCVACHTVSRDGRYLAASLGPRMPYLPAGQSYVSAVFDLTRDLSSDPAPTALVSTLGWIHATFRPDSQRLLVNTVQGGFDLLTFPSGRSIAPEGLPTRGVGNPEWSPDGRTIAYASGADNADWSIRFRRGDLTLLRALDGDRFEDEQVIHRGATLASEAERGQTDSHPTWSPDSSLLAFQHGMSSEMMGGDGALYVIAPRVGSSPRRLNRAMGGASGTDAFWPTFSPFATRELDGRTLYWLAFVSRRAYGHRPNEGCFFYERCPQIWVTAIDPAREGDASYAPYRLAGQRLGEINIAAYWARAACRPHGQACSASSECCSGVCRRSSGEPTGSTCEPPPPAQCRRRGQTCAAREDCCAGLTCIEGACDYVPPG